MGFMICVHGVGSGTRYLKIELTAMATRMAIKVEIHFVRSTEEAVGHSLNSISWSFQTIEAK